MNKYNFENIFADALKCNHCGLCLQNCPAYRKYKEEISSPRARVQIANFLIKKKITLAQDKKAILKAVLTCQNCFNCTVLCPADINPQNINQRLKNLLGIKPSKPKKQIFKNILLKLKFKKYFAKKDNLFLTSSSDFKQIKQNLEILKQNGFESSLYNKILALPSIFFSDKIFEIPINYKNYIFDDIENYRLIKKWISEGKIGLKQEQILYITQVIKTNTIKLPEDSLIIKSNVFLTQEMQKNEEELFKKFKNKHLTFVNSRYYYGPNFNEKTLQYFKQIPQKTLITLSERENKFLKTLIKKHKIVKELIMLNNIL